MYSFHENSAYKWQAALTERRIGMQCAISLQSIAHMHCLAVQYCTEVPPSIHYCREVPPVRILYTGATYQ